MYLFIVSSTHTLLDESSAGYAVVWVSGRRTSGCQSRSLFGYLPGVLADVREIVVWIGRRTSRCPIGLIMALSRALRCCQRIFSWIPVIIISSVVLWSYYAYVFELCFGKISLLIFYVCLIGLLVVVRL